MTGKSVLNKYFKFIGLVSIVFNLFASPVFSVSPFAEEAVSVNKSENNSVAATAEIAANSGEIPEVIALNSPENVSVCKKHFKPIGAWTGSLILPPSSKRDAEGSVFIKITSSPDSEKIGKIMRLTRKPLDELDQWVENLRPDVNINQKKAEAALKKGDAIPISLNGWKKVSSLESLAAARPGEMDVLLPEPEVSENRLVIKEDPVQISGAEMALIKFVGPARGKYRKIAHYGSGSFDGPEEYVCIVPEYFRKQGEAVPMSSTIDIENSNSNKEGWYIYGKRDGNVFDVEAIEPRAALRVGNAAVVSGKDGIKEFVLKNALKELKPDIFRQTLLNTNSGDNSWKVGSRALVAHVFGWRKSPAEKRTSGIILGLVTGHFAFGRAKIIECPFTGEPRWDIDYFQIYVHNRNKIVSCTQKWNAYMGNLRRGWLFTVPVADTMVQLPENGFTSIGDKKIDLYRVMRNEFEKMMSIYRTGAGTGLTSVRSDISCVQDSHAALWASFKRLDDLFAQIKGDLNANAELIKTKAGQLVKDIEKNITFHGIASGKWKEFYQKPDAKRYANVFTILWDSMLSAGTIFPRNANDRIIEMFAEHNLPMYQLLVCQMGGKIKGLMPVAPTSPKRR